MSMSLLAGILLGLMLGTGLYLLAATTVGGALLILAIGRSSPRPSIAVEHA